MSDTGKIEEKFDFDINLQYFSKLNLPPTYIRLCIISLFNYEKYNQYIPNKIESNYKKLEPKYHEKLPFDYNDKVNKVKEGMKTNQIFFTKIANLYLNEFINVEITEEYINKNIYEEQKFLGSYYLTALAREWTEEGREEREKSIKPIIEELKKFYNYEDKTLMGKGINILVIGNRFGRMTYELLKLGYNVEANERGFYFLLTSNYLFNYSKKNENCICPRINSFCSSFTEESVTKKIYFPEIDIREELKNISKDKLKITKRYFEVEYKGKKDLFDGVITLFSTEEAINIINFTEIVNNVLKKGGIWINIGSLANIYSKNGGGIDLTWDEWKHVIINSGFEIKREETPVIPFGYIKGQSSPFVRGTIFFTVQK